MTETSVRDTRRADELKPGDWIAAEEITDPPVEVLHAHTYPDGADQMTAVMYRPHGGTTPDTCSFFAGTPFDLASDAEIDALRKAAERAQKIADMRAVLAWLEANPFVPMPYSLDAHEHWSEGHGDPDTETAMAIARDVAARLGVELDVRLDDRTRLKVPFGRSSYELCVWHKDGRPAEPAPVPSRVLARDEPCADPESCDVHGVVDPDSSDCADA